MGAHLDTVLKGEGEVSDWTALIPAFSPGEKERQRPPLGFRPLASPTQPRESSKDAGNRKALSSGGLCTFKPVCPINPHPAQILALAGFLTAGNIVFR